MTVKQWNEHGKVWLDLADKYNAWREEAKHRLLSEIGPRLASLGKSGYQGCGFHYALENQFGTLVAALCKPWQPCGNHCHKIEDDHSICTVNEVLFEDLIEQIEEAEKSR